MSRKPYDDSFKTLMQECPELLVPIVNRYLGGKFPRNARVITSPNELFKKEPDGDLANRIADGVFRIRENWYHIECQTGPDGQLIIRIAEYSFLIAMREWHLSDGCLRIDFPKSAVICLRRRSKQKSRMTIAMTLPNGEAVNWEIPVIRMQDITPDEIFSDDLYFLLPFFLFRHDDRLTKIDADEQALSELDDELDDILGRMRRALKEGRLTEYHRSMILDMMKYVSQHLAKNCANVTRRLMSRMGGEIIEFPTMKKVKEAAREAAKEAAKEARIQGIAEGRAKGRAEGVILGTLQTLYGLVIENILSLSQAAKRAKMPEDEFSAGFAEYKKALA